MAKKQPKKYNVPAHKRTLPSGEKVVIAAHQRTRPTQAHAPMHKPSSTIARDKEKRGPETRQSITGAQRG